MIKVPYYARYCMVYIQQNGYSPLHAAAYFGHLSVVQLLLEHGANGDLKDKVIW